MARRYNDPVFSCDTCGRNDVALYVTNTREGKQNLCAACREAPAGAHNSAADSPGYDAGAAVKLCKPCAADYLPRELAPFTYIDAWVACDQCGEYITRETPYDAADLASIPFADVSITKEQHDALIARKTACDWHGGQSSLLYALCSTGTVKDGVQYEVSRVRENTPNNDEYARLTKLREYCMARINAAGAIIAGLALFAAVYQAPVDCWLIGETGEGFPRARCANGDVIYQDLDGAATYAAGAWVAPMG